MALPIYVDAHSGYKANERPRQFELDDELYEIAAVEEQWRSPRGSFFKVRTTNGKTYLLAYNEYEDQWTLQSGFDGDELLQRPEIELVTIDRDTIRKAESLIESCERCHPSDAEIPFDWILAGITGKRGRYDFLLTEQARCPTCKQPVTEKTLVEPT